MKTIFATIMFFILVGGGVIYNAILKNKEERTTALNSEYLCDIFEIEETYFLPENPIEVNIKVTNFTNLKINTNNLISILNSDFSRMNIKFNIVQINDDLADINGISYASLLKKEDDIQYLNLAIINENVVFAEEQPNRVIQGAASGIPEFHNPNKGRTSLFVRSGSLYTKVLSHEVGHVFGLKHTFQGYDTHNNGLNCGIGDGIPDTANVAISSVGNMTCKLYLPSELVDTFTDEQKENIVKNIMSYSPPKCMEEFTEGQSQLVRKMFEINPRLYSIMNI